MTAVSEAWTRIEHWMHQHAPASADALAPPAAPAELASAAKHLGFALPDELVETLSCHNGLLREANRLPEGSPLGTAGVIEEYEVRMLVASDLDGFSVMPTDEEPWWSPQWVPFSANDRKQQVIDLRPGAGQGRLGIAPKDGPGEFDAAWPSLGAYLTDVAQALETGRPVGYWHPYLLEDRTLWWSSAGETELNGEPLFPVRP